MTNTPDSSHFAHVREWIFDLDNTLYPHHSNLFAQVDIRITRFVSELLTLPHDEARAIQKELYRDYGTTLNGLMALHGIDPDDFLERVHDIDYSDLEADPALGEAIKALPGRRFIFTNGDRGHAERTARQLGILDHFDDIFDIVAAELEPKPAKATYRRFLDLHGVEPEKSAMFEDLGRNLEVPKLLGMKTVLIVPRNFEPTFSEIWEQDPAHDDAVDFVTDDLCAFLQTILGTFDTPG